jgi:hypothetical protein
MLMCLPGLQKRARVAAVNQDFDRCMPVLLNLNNSGGSCVENGVSYERVVKRVQPEIEGGCSEL